MQKSWDSQGIAFQPETWAALAEHLHPGAFLLAFGSTRGWHRLACAIEDAGLVIQPSVFVHGVGVVDVPGLVYHVTGQSFPKASRIDTQIDKRAGMEREVIGEYPLNRADGFQQFDGQNVRQWQEEQRSNGHGGNITLPATPLARAWAGHRYGGQVLEDMSLCIVVAQKPWTGRRLDCIVETGAGAMNVEAGRVSHDEPIKLTTRTVGKFSGTAYAKDDYSVNMDGGKLASPAPSGRWPPNCAFVHHPLCEPVTEPAPCPDCDGTGGSNGNGGVCERCGGTGEVEVGAVERVRGCLGGSFQREMMSRGYKGGGLGQRKAEDHPAMGLTKPGYADPDGTEPIPRYRCARHCPACGCWWLSETADVCPECGDEGEWGCATRLLDEDAGERLSGAIGPQYKRKSAKGWSDPFSDDNGGPASRTIKRADTGGPSRFFPCPDFARETAERLALGQTRKYAAKSSRAERDAGLDEFKEQEAIRYQEMGQGPLPQQTPRAKTNQRNPHPTLKPLELTEWLASLLLPPDIYAPRRLLCPFFGTGSEGIGAMLAGWEHVTGIEMSEEYCEIAEARVRFWQGWSEHTGEREPKAILKAAKKAQQRPGQTPQPPVPMQPVAEQLAMKGVI